MRASVKYILDKQIFTNYTEINLYASLYISASVEDLMSSLNID